MAACCIYSLLCFVDCPVLQYNASSGLVIPHSHVKVWKQARYEGFQQLLDIIPERGVQSRWDGHGGGK